MTTYHVVAIYSDGYIPLAQTRGTLENACNLFLHLFYTRRGCMVLRDGSTGERITAARAKKFLNLPWYYEGEQHRTA